MKFGFFSTKTGPRLAQSVTPVRPRLRAAFICTGNPESAGTWSGTPLHMLTHLRPLFDVTTVVREPWAKWFGPARKVVSRLTRGKIDLIWSPFWTALASRKARQAIAADNVDIVFCVGVSSIAALMNKTHRCVFISDATVVGMIDYNPKFTAMSAALRKRAIAIETDAVSRSDAAFYPSEWARDDALRFHGAIPAKTHYVNWGANLTADCTPLLFDLTPPWRFLFIGVNWQAKGGDIAVETVRRLNEMGIKAQLDVVGSRPADPNFADPNVTLHGFLDKNVLVERDKLMGLLRGSNLLLFPTQFEALGIVSAEAASFGVPTVAYRTGGVAANIVDGETGILLPPEAAAEVWANAIFTLIKDQPRYAAMRHAALAWHRSTVNWPTWAEAIADVLAPRPQLLIRRATLPKIAAPHDERELLAA